MNKTNLIGAVAAKAAVSKADAGRVVEALIKVITEGLKKGESVQLTGFGTFEVTQTSARKGRNPATGAEIQIPAGKRVKFTAGAALKKAVRG